MGHSTYKSSILSYNVMYVWATVVMRLKANLLGLEIIYPTTD